MNDHPDLTPGPEDDEEDPVLAAAGARLRHDSPAIEPEAVQVAVLQRRSKRLGVLVSVLAVALVGGGVLMVQQRSSSSEPDRTAADLPGSPPPAEVDAILASLDARPIDPTQVQLVSTVSTYADCDALIGDLRRVGARHVGSRGFGGFDFYPAGYGRDVANRVGLSDEASAYAPDAMSGGGGDTLETNVQVAGVDELDFVKASGTLIYDLDRKGNLRITDTGTMEVMSVLDVTPGHSDEPEPFGGGAGVHELLVADGRVIIFGTEYEISDPVEGDPSATRSSTSYMTVAFVDASDPATPELTDRVRIEGSLVSARLVDGEVRLVTTSNMADLGFVLPTTPNSVAKALEQNRRSVASSVAADWIPDYHRTGEDPVPLVPCERVHVPDTFSGVAMTSMVTFSAGAGRFEPAGTSILAPATTLYAGLDKVAISSEVWVDPIDRERLEFDDWQTAIHEFHFADATAPTYMGSGIVDGSTIGQFAFGEIADSLAVVTTNGTPWSQNPDVGVDMTILTPDGDGGLGETAKVADLADGKGQVTAVRFLDGRVLISTGFFGREIHVLDVTDPAAPRRAGQVPVATTVGYFHPLPEHQALVIGSRHDQVGEGNNRRSRSWVEVQLLDIADPDAPQVLAGWERPWVADNVGGDHHAFTYWPSRKLALWGLQNTEWHRNGGQDPNHALVLGVDGGLDEVAVPVANKPDEAPAPCPRVEVPDPEAQRMIGPDGIVLRCDRGTQEIEWPRYDCQRVDASLVARFAPGEQDQASFFWCSPAAHPHVSRVLVVDGVPILYTDQTLETLDPTTFASASVTFHPAPRRW